MNEIIELVTPNGYIWRGYNKYSIDELNKQFKLLDEFMEEMNIMPCGKKPKPPKK